MARANQPSPPLRLDSASTTGAVSRFGSARLGKVNAPPPSTRLPAGQIAPSCFTADESNADTCWTISYPLMPAVPAGPCAPGAPCGPGMPCGPVSPFGPGPPAGPCVPGSPLSPFGPGPPAGPCAPGSPLSPFGPATPIGPVAPVAPVSPCGPAWFQVSCSSPLAHFLPACASITRSLPVSLS